MVRARQKKSPGEKAGRSPVFARLIPSFVPAGLCATAQQKEQKQNWNRHAEKPEQHVTGSADLLDFLF
jgi:hypothetical protein